MQLSWETVYEKFFQIVSSWHIWISHPLWLEFSNHQQLTHLCLQRWVSRKFDELHMGSSNPRNKTKENTKDRPPTVCWLTAGRSMGGEVERQESIFSGSSESLPGQPVDEGVDQVLVRATTWWRTEKRTAKNKWWHKVAVWELVEGKESIAGVMSQETGPKICQFPWGGEEIISLVQNMALSWSGVLRRDPEETSEPAETAKNQGCRAKIALWRRRACQVT